MKPRPKYMAVLGGHLELLPCECDQKPRHLKLVLEPRNAALSPAHARRLAEVLLKFAEAGR